MTGKTLKELNVQHGDVVELTHSNDGDFVGDVCTITDYGDALCNDGSGLHSPDEDVELGRRWRIVSRATLDLSTLSREELEELGQRVAVELEKKPEVVTLAVCCMRGCQPYLAKEMSNPTHTLRIAANNSVFIPGTYTSSDGDVIKVEKV